MGGAGGIGGNWARAGAATAPIPRIFKNPRRLSISYLTWDLLSAPSQTGEQPSALGSAHPDYQRATAGPGTTENNRPGASARTVRESQPAPPVAPALHRHYTGPSLT